MLMLMYQVIYFLLLTLSMQKLRKDECCQVHEKQMVLAHYENEWPAVGKVKKVCKPFIKIKWYTGLGDNQGELSGQWFPSKKYKVEKYEISKLYFIFDSLENNYLPQSARQAALKFK